LSIGRGLGFEGIGLLHGLSVQGLEWIFLEISELANLNVALIIDFFAGNSWHLLATASQVID